MNEQPMRTIAVVGAGLVGLGWAVVFARAGCAVRIYDSEAGARHEAPARLSAMLEDLASFGLVEAPGEIGARITVFDRLEEAVGPADYVQESVFERIDAKTAACREIGRAIRPDAIVGSSSSGIPASAFTAEAENRSRFLIAHPVNPPHLVPVVELVPAPWTTPSVVSRLRDFMTEVGQEPILVHQEIEGFVLNRLQGVLLNEAWALFEAGVASAEDIDKTISQGLGLRWSFMGPFETIDLNAPGGIADYARRLGPLYHSIALSRTAPPRPWGSKIVDKAEAERRRVLPATALRDRAAWRDRRLMALVAHRRAQPKA